MRLKGQTPTLPCRWEELKTADFTRLDFDRTVVLFPVAAIEQHGPHLPVATDLVINEGIVDRALSKLEIDAPILRLPTQAIGKSDEHSAYPGTLSISTELVYETWLEIGESVRRAGIRKIVIFNSHGGNSQLAQLVARDLRIDQQMLVAAIHWSDLGLPQGLIDEHERRHGIHGGDIETSLMMALLPEWIDGDQIKDFPLDFGGKTAVTAWAKRLGFDRWGWQTHDLNVEGALGNASQATADKGEAILDHLSRALAELLLEITDVPLQVLMNQPRIEEPR